MRSHKGSPVGVVLWTCKVAQKTRPLGVWRHSKGREAATLISLFISFQFGKRGCLTTNVLVSCLAAALGEPLEKPGRKPPVLYSEQGLAWGHTLNNEEKTKYWIAACSANPVPLGCAGPCVRECMTWGSFPLALGTGTASAHRVSGRTGEGTLAPSRYSGRGASWEPLCWPRIAAVNAKQHSCCCVAWLGKHFPCRELPCAA